MEAERKEEYKERTKAVVIEYKWLLFWILVALVSFIAISVIWGKQMGLEFAGGYIIELSLSVDNLFVFLFIFTSFHIDEHSQHRVLNYGVAGTVILRFLFLFVGLSLVRRFEWIFYVFGALLILSGIRMFKSEDEDSDPHDGKIFRLVKKILPMTTYFSDDKFVVKRTEGNVGRDPSWIASHSNILFTPLAAVLVLIIFADVIFAIDSVPAVLSMTRNIFLVYSSNFLAVMGMRQLFFVVEHMHARFAYVKYAVAVILIFTGAKMLVGMFGIHVDNLLSIIVICSLLAAGIIVSMVISKREKKKALQEALDEEMEEESEPEDTEEVEKP